MATRRSLDATLLLILLLLAGGAPLVLGAPSAEGFLLCHFAHLSARHLFFSGLATVVMGAGLERRFGTARLIALVASSMVAVSGAVLAFERGRLVDYQGASGLGYALAGALAAALPKRWAVAVLGFLAVKVGFEFATGRCLVDVSLEAAGAVPVPSAHAAGLVVGAALGAIFSVTKSRESSQDADESPRSDALISA